MSVKNNIVFIAKLPKGYDITIMEQKQKLVFVKTITITKKITLLNLRNAINEFLKKEEVKD